MIKNLKKIDFWILTVIFLLLVFKIETKRILIYQPLNDTVVSLKKTTSSFFDGIKFFFVDYVNLVNIKKENIKLANKNRILMVENSLLTVYKNEIESLKAALNLKKDYIKLNLAIIKNIINNFNTANNNLMALNISNDLVEKDLGVITEKGVVGITDKIKNDKISIMPVTSPDISIPVWVGENKIFAFATGVNNNKELKLKLKYVENNSKIKAGDKIITNGYDAIFPEGIYIGKVLRIKEIKNNIFVSIDVELPEGLFKSKYFFVIKR